MKQKIKIMILLLTITMLTTTTIPGEKINTKEEPTPNAETWIKKININEWDQAWDVKQTSDGGYIVLGDTHKFDENLNEENEDFLLIKQNNKGKVLWQKTYGNEQRNLASSVLVKPNGNIIIVGWTLNFETSDDPVIYTYIIETDNEGNKIKENKIPDNPAYYAELTNDGGFVIASGFSGMTIIKIDENLQKQWLKKYDYYTGSHVVANAYGVDQTNDGGYILIGETGTKDENNEYNLWIIKTNSEGKKQWDKTFGGPETDIGYYIEQNQNQEFIITGYTRSYGNADVDLWLIKTDQDGNELWNKTYGGRSTDYGRSLKITNNNEIIIAGITTSYSQNNMEDIWLLKTDSNGEKIWDKTYGNEDLESIGQISLTNDGGYIIAGGTVDIKVIFMNLWDLYIIKTNQEGEVKSKTKTKNNYNPIIQYIIEKPFFKTMIKKIITTKIPIDKTPRNNLPKLK